MCSPLVVVVHALYSVVTSMVVKPTKIHHSDSQLSAIFIVSSIQFLQIKDQI